MTKEIRERRNVLKMKCAGLRESANRTRSLERGVMLRELEAKCYNLWKFYDGLIKAFDNLKSIELDD